MTWFCQSLNITLWFKIYGSLILTKNGKEEIDYCDLILYKIGPTASLKWQKGFFWGGGMGDLILKDIILYSITDRNVINKKF